MKLSQNEREEETYLTYYEQHGRGTAGLDVSEQTRLNELRCKGKRTFCLLCGEPRAEAANCSIRGCPVLT
jgi:hypothetical protein